jgi:hypothetical protein
MDGVVMIDTERRCSREPWRRRRREVLRAEAGSDESRGRGSDESRGGGKC